MTRAPKSANPPVTRETLLLLAFVFLASTVGSGTTNASLTTVMFGALLVVAAATPLVLWATGSRSGRTVWLLALAATGIWSLLAVVDDRWIQQYAQRPALLVGVVVVVAATARWLAGKRWLSIAAAVALAAVVIIAGANALSLYSPPGIDVYYLHEAAVDRLAAGMSPYHGLGVEDTSPLAGAGAVIDGYPYPPVTLVIFSAADWIFGDARWAGVIAVAVVAFLLARSGGTAGRYAALVLAAAFVAQPGWLTIVAQAFTEPVSLALLAGAVVAWRRPVASAVLLGLALASKQYFIVLLPLVLLIPDRHRYRRAVVALGVVFVSLLPALSDPAGFWSSAVEFHLTRPPRPDSLNLTGFGIEVPTAVLLVVSLAAAVVLARGAGTAAGFAAASTATLAVFFLGTGQAFLNYWFLVAGLAVVAAAARLIEDDRYVVESKRSEELSAVDLGGERVHLIGEP